jgi:hypothetical protein
MTETTAYTTGPVCIDDVVTVLAEYDPAYRWNGWLACPRMDALSVVAVMDALSAAGGTYTYAFTEDGTLTLTDPDERDYADETLPYTETYVPDEDGTYALGESGWVWSEDPDAAECEVCGFPLMSGDEPGTVQASGRDIAVCSVRCTVAALDADRLMTTTAAALAALLSTPLTTTADAVAWIHDMTAIGYGCHPDDRGADIVNLPSGEATFTPADATRYDARMSEVFALVADPYAVSLDAVHAVHGEGVYGS